MNEKQKIVAILMEALRVAGINKLKGVRYSTRVQCYKDSERLDQLKKDIKIKVELFESMNVECDSYKHILGNAKLALDQLKENDYRFNSYELINNFLNLTDVFRKNNLKFIGIREVEEKGKKHTEKQEIGIPSKITHDKVSYLGVGVQGKHLVKAKEEEMKIDELVEFVEL